MARRNGSGPKDVTVEILKQIRDDMRGMRAEQELTNERLEVVETTLRDLAEQMTVLARAVTT